MRSARALTASLLDTSSPLKQDLANYATEPMGKRPRPRTDRLGRAADGRRQPENDCFLRHSRVRCVVQHSAQALIAFRRATEGNVLAWAPASAMIRCAESTPKPGTSASRITASW